MCVFFFFGGGGGGVGKGGAIFRCLSRDFKWIPADSIRGLLISPIIGGRQQPLNPGHELIESPGTTSFLFL